MTANPELKIVKPSFSEKFKSKNGPTISGVQTLLTALPIIKIGDVDDWTRLHPSEDDYWSCEIVLRLGADQGRQAQHAARHRRRPRGAVPASQENQAVPAGAGLQAEQCVLFLHRTEPESRQHLECRRAQGLPSGANALGAGDVAAVRGCRWLQDRVCAGSGRLRRHGMADTFARTNCWKSRSRKPISTTTGIPACCA